MPHLYRQEKKLMSGRPRWTFFISSCHISTCAPIIFLAITPLCVFWVRELVRKQDRMNFYDLNIDQHTQKFSRVFKQLFFTSPPWIGPYASLTLTSRLTSLRKLYAVNNTAPCSSLRNRFASASQPLRNRFATASQPLPNRCATAFLGDRLGWSRFNITCVEHRSTWHDNEKVECKRCKVQHWKFTACSGNQRSHSKLDLLTFCI